MHNTDWIDRTEYPFAPHYFNLKAGRMHYVDEGQGRPMVLVHGTPTWSFLYRHMVKELSPHYRCIAPDHLGFGLSDKPPHLDYRPRDLAANLRTLIDDHLGLEDITLVVHDFGGPIGLSYAIERPENVHSLVLFNTWMWSRQHEPSIKWAVKFFASPPGKFLYTRLNISPRWLIPSVMGERRKLTPNIHQHYIAPFPQAADRCAMWMFTRHMIDESDWYAQLWQQRQRIADKPALLLWGLKDPFFNQQHLENWRELLPQATVQTFPGAGHLVQEEAPDLGSMLLNFLSHQQPGAPAMAAHHP
jgi:haloalkane dehalogenase